MNPTSHRSLRFLVFVALAGVAVCTAGAIYAVRTHADGPLPAKSGDNSPGAAPAPGPGLVASGYSDVEGGVLALYPLQSGRVIRVYVKEGQLIKKEDIGKTNDKGEGKDWLLKVDDTLAKQKVAEAKADVADAAAQLRLAEKVPAQHKAKIEAQMAAVAAMKQRLAGAELAAKRKWNLVKSKQLDKLEAQAADKQVEEIDEGIKGEEAQLRALKAVDPEEQKARARADVEFKKARLAQAEYGLEQCILKAPGPGEVFQIHVGEGSIVSPSQTQPAVVFGPPREEERIIRAEVEQEFAGRLAVGQTVKVQDEFNSKQTWTGKVERISNWYTSRRSQTPDPLRLNTNDVRVLDCIIKLDKGPEPPRMGQHVRVIIGR